MIIKKKFTHTHARAHTHTHTYVHTSAKMFIFSWRYFILTYWTHRIHVSHQYMN